MSDDISVKTDDFDTLGGRLYRARDAINATPEEISAVIGVEMDTLRAWESDRSEPRSNKLTMLAAALGTSPSWLLFGRGAGPLPESVAAHGDAAEQDLKKLKSQQKLINAAIENMETAMRAAKSG